MLTSSIIKLTRSKFLSGFLRLNGREITQIQRILDPTILTGLYILLQPSLLWRTPFASFPSWYLVALATFIALPQSGIYRSYRHRSLTKLLQKINSSWLLILSLLLLAAFFNKSTASFPRIASTAWAMSGWLWLFTSHIILRKVLRIHRTNGGNSRTIVYWGTSEAAKAFSQQIADRPWMGYKIIGWFSPIPVTNKTQIQLLPSCGGGRQELRDWLGANKVDWLIFSHIDSNETELNQMISLFGDTSVSVLYAPTWSHPSMHFSVDSVGDQLCVELWGNDQRWLDRQIKRFVDLTLTSIGVIIISPLLVCIAIAVKLSSPGPILYKQDRYGLDGKKFKCIKY